MKKMYKPAPSPSPQPNNDEKKFNFAPKSLKSLVSQVMMLDSPSSKLGWNSSSNMVYPVNSSSNSLVVGDGDGEKVGYYTKASFETSALSDTMPSLESSFHQNQNDVVAEQQLQPEQNHLPSNKQQHHEDQDPSAKDV